MKISKFLTLSVIAILSMSCQVGQAQEMTFSEESSISIGAVLSFQSEILSEEREIIVSLPDSYHTSTKRYPVIYLLDAQGFFLFQYTYGVINALDFIEKIPEVILVGVRNADRTRDLTLASPTNKEGNADNFIEFFRSELQVLIEQEYRTEPYKILIGHSAGGLFALHTLFQAPDTFNAYIALSPALQHDNGNPLATVKERFETGMEFNNTLFTSIASEGGRMLEHYELFLSALTESNLSGLTFSRKAYPNEAHISSNLPGIYDGVLSVYRNWAPTDSIDSLVALLSHYQGLSERYGYTVDVPAKHASDLGFKLMSSGEPEEALEVFKYSLANISQDAVAHYSVGFALRRLGRLTEALEEFDEAIELGAGTEMYPFYIRFRDEVFEELNSSESVIK